MKWILPLLMSGALALGEDITTTTGEVYKDVTISRAEPDGLVLITDAGIEKVPFAKLPKEIQQKYGYNPKDGAEFAKATAAAQREAQARAQAARAAERAKAAQLASEAENRSTSRNPVNVLTASPSTPQSGSGSLKDAPASKVSIYGYVVNREKDGLLIFCKKRADAIGGKQAEGSVWLTGVDFAEGAWVKIFATSTGTKDYYGSLKDSFAFVSGRKIPTPAE